jgi:EAL domain-containing protein (putative c-di-GMP-specific phosphodiesterase class I)
MGPDSFIPVAEQTGLIVPLGEWVLDEACGALHALQASWASRTSSSRSTCRRASCASASSWTAWRTCLRRHGVRRLPRAGGDRKPADGPPRRGAGGWARLKELGVRLSIDDFGTGYSSLSHLQAFPVDYIKIDRSFLGGVAADGHLVITRAIIALGHNLKLKVIAEGVETREQLVFLRDNDCDQMQGYYFSPALSQQGLADMLSRGVTLHA